MITIKLISFNNRFSIFLSYFLTKNKIPFLQNKSMFTVQLSCHNYHNFFFFLKVCQNNITDFSNLLNDFVFFQEDESFLLEEQKPLTKKKRGYKYNNNSNITKNLLFYTSPLTPKNFTFNILPTSLFFFNFFYMYTFFTYTQLFLWFYKLFLLQLISDYNSPSSKI